MNASLPNLIKTAPVTSLSAAESITAFVLTFLVAHHVIGNVNVSSEAQTLAPFVALVIPVIFGTATWALVSPYDKVKHWAEQEGLLSDADFARIEGAIESQLDDYLAGAGAGPGGAADNGAGIDSGQGADDGAGRAHDPATPDPSSDPGAAAVLSNLNGRSAHAGIGVNLKNL